MITASRGHKHPSCSTKRPTDFGVTVNINVEVNLIAVNHIIECISRDLITKYFQGLKFSMVYTAPPGFLETLTVGSNRNIPRLPLYIGVQAAIHTFYTLNMYIARCLPQPRILIRLRSCKLFKVLVIIIINQWVCHCGNLNFGLQCDPLLNWLARGIRIKEGVPYPRPPMVITTLPHFCWTILALKISLKVWLVPFLQYSIS
jgi:hypothetical protein